MEWLAHIGPWALLSGALATLVAAVIIQSRARGKLEGEKEGEEDEREAFKEQVAALTHPRKRGSKLVAAWNRLRRAREDDRGD